MGGCSQAGGWGTLVLVECYACDLEAVAECPRCGALFCDEHGEALCARCMEPNLALPSYRVYRGSLLALLVGSVFAVWLLVLPPDGADSDAPPASLAGVLPSATPSPAATAEATPAAPATAAGEPAGTPGGVAAAPTQPAPSATATATPAPTAASGIAEEYTVRPGDSMSLIADSFLAPGGDVEAFLQRIVDLNGISDPSSIAVGQVIAIPAQ